MRVVEYPRGTTIFHKEDDGNLFYTVLSGNIDCYVPIDHYEMQIILQRLLRHISSDYFIESTIENVWIYGGTEIDKDKREQIGWPTHMQYNEREDNTKHTEEYYD